MGSQNKTVLPPILGNEIPLDNYPECAATEMAEQKVSATLPAITALEIGLSDEQRLSVLKDRVALERAAFIAAHGDPFGEIWAPEKDAAVAEVETALQA